MTRLEKKCFTFSIGLHGLLAVIVIGSAAFRTAPERDELPLITFIPSKILDTPGVGGGNPEVAVAPQPPPTPQPPQPQPQPQPPQVKEVAHPKPRQPDPEPEPTPMVTDRPSPVREHKPLKKPHEIKVDLTETTVTHKVTPEDDAAAQRAEERKERAEARRQQAQLAKVLGRMATAIETKTAKANVFDLPGQGGGETFADYRTVVYSTYYNAWTAPDEVADNDAVTEVRIVVARDGSIISAQITSKSGTPAMDRSVQRALDFVKSLPPFPPEAKDAERSFRIRFNLKAKQSLG